MRRKDSGKKGGRRREEFPGKKGFCRFCKKSIEIDYKNPTLLRSFLTERGKILPRKKTNVCNKHQRILATHIKRARILALLPFVAK